MIMFIACIMFHMWYTCNIIDLGANNLCSELLASKVLFSSLPFLWVFQFVAFYPSHFYVPFSIWDVLVFCFSLGFVELAEFSYYLQFCDRNSVHQQTVDIAGNQ
jgi:hypothetical protein